MEKQLRESIDYIAIARGTAKPVRLDTILQQRMDAFIDRRLASIRNQT